MDRRLSSFVSLFMVVALRSAAGSAASAATNGFLKRDAPAMVAEVHQRSAVLRVFGHAPRIGRQRRILTANAMKQLANLPTVHRQLHKKDRWGETARRAKSLCPHSRNHLAEIRAFGEESGIDSDVGHRRQHIGRLYRGVSACSSLIVEPERAPPADRSSAESRFLHARPARQFQSCDGPPSHGKTRPFCLDRFSRTLSASLGA